MEKTKRKTEKNKLEKQLEKSGKNVGKMEKNKIEKMRKVMKNNWRKKR